MALFRKFFYRKPPDGLLEISERVYVFDCCFTTDMLEDEEYKVYIGGIVGQLRDHFPDASFMVFNFREGEHQSQIASILSEYDMTVMDYPRHYEGCPLLTMEMIHHFLRSSESWLSLVQQNVLLVHCERGGWPILAFMLAALLIYRKQFSGEQKTLDTIYKQAPRELLQLMSPLNPLPSQLRYLQYVSRRNVGVQWPPLDRALTLDCIILRFIPNFDGEGGCRPIFRIYGQDPFMAADRTPKVLFSMPKRSKLVRHYKQADCELVKIDISCHIQGDVVLECISLDSDQEREEMMFRVMFNTAFIRSNILMLNRDEIDILWNARDKFSKDFRAEVIFSEMDAATSIVPVDMPGIEEKDGLPMEAFAKVQEIFSNVDWMDPKSDVAINVLQHITAANILQENLETFSPRSAEAGLLLESALEKVKERTKAIVSEISLKSPATLAEAKETIPSVESVEPDIGLKNPMNLADANETIPSLEPSSDASSVQKKVEAHELQVALQHPAQPKIISQRIPQISLSAPVSYSNSLQASPVSISRFHSAPSALGITALLHDHAASQSGEFTCPVTLSLPSPASSPIANLQKIQPGQIHALPPASSMSPLPPSLQFPNGPPAIIQKMSAIVSPHPPLPSQSALRATVDLPTQHPKSQVRGSTSSVPLPPPLPSFSGASTSSHIKSSCLTSPPLPPPPPRSGASTSAPIKSSHSAPPPPPPPSLSGASTFAPIKSSCSNPLLSPSPPSLLSASPSPMAKSTSSSSPPPAPPLPSLSRSPQSLTVKCSNPLPPPPLPGIASSAPSLVSSLSPMKNSVVMPGPPPPPPPPLRSGGKSLVPPPPLPLGTSLKSGLALAPPVPPPPAPFAKRASDDSVQSHQGVGNGNIPAIPGPPAAPFGAKGRGLLRTSPRSQSQPRKANLKPYHWLKLTRVMQGSLWAETQKPEEASKAPEIDLSELESLFSAAAPNSDHGSKGGKSNRRASLKSEKVQLIELRRAYNCEIMLSKVKIPLPDLMSSVLTLDESALDVDQVDNLIKFCPTKEEMELLKGYNGDKENLGKCEQFFLELMKVPRVESKLRVFSFKIQFCSQVSDLRKSLNIVNSAAEEVRNSVKLKRIMQTILSLGNALNHGTARGSAIGFRLDSLLKLTDTRARNNKMTLMHYLCKVLAEKLPELLDFPKDLVSLEAATKIQLKYLAEEMQAISKGLEKVVQELTASENDGLVSEIFCQTLKEFLSFAESEVRSLASLYSSVGRSADALALYFGEDPARVPFEQVVSTLLNFVRTFIRAQEENYKQLEFEKKKAQKDAENEKLKMVGPKRESENLIPSIIK